MHPLRWRHRGVGRAAKPPRAQRERGSSPPPPLDTLERCELGKGLSAVAAQPAVIVAEDVEAVAVDRALNPRP
jgi:hypothetical protein